MKTPSAVLDLPIERPQELSTDLSVGSDGLVLGAAQLSTEQEEIVAGTGRCYSCDCPGYRRSKDVNWCMCGHHWDRHQ